MLLVIRSNTMPELPEVETIRRGLVPKVCGKKIVNVWIEPSFQKKISPSARKFLTVLKNKKFSSIERRAKLIVFKILKKLFLLVHLKMTGQLVYRSAKGKSTASGHPIIEDHLPNKFTRVVFSFVDGTKLYFNDIRKFGYMKLVGQSELAGELKKYGSEPFGQEFNFDYFKKIIDQNKKKRIKAFLLDQTLIAGLGNIYSDEVCFEARVKPTRNVGKLRLTEKKNVFVQIKRVLKKALKFKGTSVDTYVVSDGKQGRFQKYLKVYGRAGRKCLRCVATIRKLRFNGRNSCHCPICQR